MVKTEEELFDMRHERVTSIGMLLMSSFLGGAVASAVFAGRLQAQPQSSIVTAEQLNLVDRTGRLRGLLSAEDERGGVSLSLVDAAGEVRALLGVASNGTPQLRLYDEAGASSVAVTVDRSGPVLEISGDPEQVTLLGTPGGSPTLSFLQEGQSRVELGVSSAGAPRLVMFSGTGQRRASMVVGEDGAPLLTLYDDSGYARVRVGVLGGASVINMADENRPRIVLGVAPNGVPGLNFLDEGGQIFHGVP